MPDGKGEDMTQAFEAARATFENLLEAVPIIPFIILALFFAMITALNKR
jgi:hypothetical protein